MIAASSPSRLATAVGATVYVAALAAVGFGPFSRVWGLDSIRYVTPMERALCMACALLGLILVWSGVGAGSPRPPGRKKQGSESSIRLGATWVAGFAGAALLLWIARDRSHYLGDGRIWIENLKAGRFPRYSEPLSAGIWQIYTSTLRGLGVVPGPDALALLSVASGLIAGLLLWWIVREIAPPPARATALGLLASLGAGMLYFGYIEIYPIVSLAVLAYVLLALRSLRGAMPPIVVAAALALAMGSHLICMVLIPSYAYVIVRTQSGIWRRVALAVAPLLIAIGLFALLNLPLSEAARPFGVLSVALRSTAGRATPSAGSILAPVSDLASVLLLVLPVPLLLFLASRLPPRGSEPPDAARVFLAFAAVFGLLGALALVVPGSPAQDWDLMAITVLPFAILCVREGLAILASSRPPFRAGLVALSVAGLAPFVLVNASEPSALSRLAALVGPDSRSSAHERAYGNEKIARTYMDRRDFAAALPYARASLEAESTNARYWTNLGEVLNELGRVDQAIPLLRRAVELAPGRWDARYDLGLCYVKQERYDAAAEALHGAVAAGGDRPDVHHLWGIALYRSGQADSAVAVWRGILARWPAYAARLQSGATPGGAIQGETPP